jgi:uroporphyrinogen-III decarboxylase
MLSSRDRLLRCIRHRTIDRVPVSTYEMSGWNENAWENEDPTYSKLMDAIRKHTDCIYMYDPFCSQGYDPLTETESWTEGVSEFTRKVLHTDKGDLTALYRTDKNIHTTWTLKHFLESIDDIDKYLSLPGEFPVHDMELILNEQKMLGDRGVMMLSLADPVCIAAELYEMGTFLVHAVTETEKIKYLLDAIHEKQMHALKQELKHDVKDIIFRICGPEYVTPPYLSPEYFHDLVTRYLIEICREIKNAGAIPRIHSHGKIGRVIDQFAMTDAEGLDPVEPPPDGDISLADVKKLYGGKFCLFGNIELKELETADRKRIDMLVKKAMEDAMEGSGFILMTTASPINSPLAAKTEENYMQMFESALRYGCYQ